MYGQGCGAVFPEDRFPGIEDFCKAVVRGFSRRGLCQIRDNVNRGYQVNCDHQKRPSRMNLIDRFGVKFRTGF